MSGPLKRLILEMGSGSALHGGDYTKAAKRALQDAIRHSSLTIVRSLKIDPNDLHIELTLRSCHGQGPRSTGQPDRPGRGRTEPSCRSVMFDGQGGQGRLERGCLYTNIRTNPSISRNRTVAHQRFQ